MKTPLLLIALIAGLNQCCVSQQIILYDNHFESPNIPPVPNCGSDLDATDLNTLWSGTAGGTGGGGSFQQVNTVETILIHGPDGFYSDPSGIGDSFCISMLSVAQDDQAALTLNSQMLPFAIISMDISAIDLDACGGPFGVDTPLLDIKIYDSPGAVFSFAAPGTLLDEDTIKGIAPGATSFTFNWTNQLVSMDIANTTDGNITVVLDLLKSGYAAIDNLLIVSSLTSIGPVQSNQNKIVLFPNPVADVLNVQGKISANTKVKFYNPFGQFLLEEKINADRKINVSTLPAGMYWVEIKNEDQPVVLKMVKD